MINWLDYALIVIILLGLTIGYLQGLLRQVMNLAAMYLGTILAAQYFRVLGNFFKSQLATTPGTLLNAVSFFIIMIAVTVLLNFLTADAYKKTKLTLFPIFDRLGGMVLGFVAAWILIALAIDMVTYATASQYWTSAEQVREVLRSGIAGSFLAPSTEATLPRILDAIRPWLPSGIPAIFTI